MEIMSGNLRVIDEYIFIHSNDRSAKFFLFDCSVVLDFICRVITLIRDRLDNIFKLSYSKIVLH